MAFRNIDIRIVPWIDQLTWLYISSVPLFLKVRRRNKQHIKSLRVIRISPAIKTKSLDRIFDNCHLGFCQVPLGLADMLKHFRRNKSCKQPYNNNHYKQFYQRKCLPFLLLPLHLTTFHTSCFINRISRIVVRAANGEPLITVKAPLHQQSSQRLAAELPLL